MQEQLPSFPVPLPHGVLHFGKYGLLFTSFIPGYTLEEVWPRLDNEQKHAISGQLDALLSELRSLSLPDHTPFGGIQERDVRTEGEQSESIASQS